MKKTIALILAMITVLLLTASCMEKQTNIKPADQPGTSAPAGDEKPGETAKPVEAGPLDLENDLSTFDHELMEYIEGKLGDESYMISPLSFKYALGMLIAGADGDTLGQLNKAVGVKTVSELEEYIKSFNGFETYFNKRVKDYTDMYNSLSDNDKQYYDVPSGALRVANSIWKRSDLPEFLQGYKDAVGLYSAEYRDFTLDKVIEEVNAWANEKTEGMIPKLLPEDYDTTDLAVILMNALYYKNSWSEAFTEAGDREFTAIDGSKATKKFITVTGSFRYYSDDGTALVIVPMKNGVDMIFVLGSVDGITEKISKAENRSVRVLIPEFETETSLSNGELVDFLKARGAADAFSMDKADFSKMFSPDKKKVYVDDIVQKTKIKLDETGVEAAAVTAIMMRDEAIADPGEAVDFIADKPFRYFITTAKTGAGAEGVVLFEGRLTK